MLARDDLRGFAFPTRPTPALGVLFASLIGLMVAAPAVPARASVPRVVLLEDFTTVT